MSKALLQLVAGNARAVSSGRARPQPCERRPTAAVLACTDERITPPLIFDEPPGKLYTVRMAGNVFTPEVAGSLEIAVERLKCPLIVVLGHTDCTAVHIARSRQKCAGRTYEVTRRIRVALEKVPPEAPLTAAVEANVRHTIHELRERWRELSDREKKGTLEIAGAIYEIETGRVRFL